MIINQFSFSILTKLATQRSEDYQDFCTCPRTTFIELTVLLFFLKRIPPRFPDQLNGIIKYIIDKRCSFRGLYSHREDETDLFRIYIKVVNK